MIPLLACALVVASAASGPDSASALLDGFFGQPNVAAVTGNGGLTVGVNAGGGIAVCRWPSPSYYNQVRIARSENAGVIVPGTGLLWGLRFKDRTVWLNGSPWKMTLNAASDSNVICIGGVLPDTGLSATASYFVMPQNDVLVCHVEAEGMAEAPEVVFYANFSPCTRLLPELPVADWLLDAWNDFAAFTPDRGKSIFHFRPVSPGLKDIQAAAQTAANPAATGSDWSSFGKGTWIGYLALQPVSQFQCGRDGGTDSAFLQAGAGTLGGCVSSLGSCDSAVVLKTTPMTDNAARYGATVLVAFGPTYADVQAVLQANQSTPFSLLLQVTEQHWREMTARVALPAADDATRDQCLREIMTLVQLMDKSSGAVVRSVAASPPLALDWPRHGTWVTFALDLAGLHDLAEAHALFYPSLIRTNDAPGMPRGSLPAAAYANGAAGLPDVVLEADAGAWMLGSFWRHAAMLEDTERNRFLGKVNESGALAADFLVRWADARTGMPLFSFDPRQCKDTRSLDHLLTAFMGMDAALRMTAVQGGQAPDDWRRRKRDLDRLIRLNCVDEKGQWKAPDILPYWAREVAQTELPAWDQVVGKALAAKEPGTVTVEDVCGAALVYEGKPQRLAALIPLLDAASRPAWPDALDAAQHFVAASLIYGGPSNKGRSL